MSAPTSATNAHGSTGAVGDLRPHDEGGTGLSASVDQSSMALSDMTPSCQSVDLHLGGTAEFVHR
jgi:hypothetical protein